MNSATWLSYPPFYEQLGVVLESLEAGTCRLSLPASRAMSNSKGDLHGGAIACMTDIALSQAIRSSYAGTVNVATISMTLNYLAPASGSATTHAKVLRAGSTIAYAEAETLNEQGETICRASGSYRIIRTEKDASHPNGPLSS